MEPFEGPYDQHFEYLKNELMLCALELGCNVALLDALKFSRSKDDLCKTVNQATGAGSQRFKEFAEIFLCGYDRRREKCSSNP